MCFAWLALSCSLCFHRCNEKLPGKPRTDTKLLTIVKFVVHWHRNQDEANFIKVKVMVMLNFKHRGSEI